MSDDLRNNNFQLGVSDFTYADLFDAVRLKDLADVFYADIAQQEPVLGDALKKYIWARGHGFERKVESKILTDAAPFLSDFVARLFKITKENTDLAEHITVQNPVWRYKFFVQRRAAKKFKPEELGLLNEPVLWTALTQLRNVAFDETLVRDEELSIAEMACRLLDAEESLGKDAAEMPAATHDTVMRVNAAYDKLKDTEAGKLFAEFVLSDEATGDLLTIKAALHIVEVWSAVAFAAPI